MSPTPPDEATTGTECAVELDRVSKLYPNGTQAVSELSLRIETGEFMVLVGPSGCGKTTALRMIAGLEEISSGTLRIGQRVVNDLAPKDRDIAMVFQSYALYPHMTVADNIAFPLTLHKVPKAEIARRVTEAARVLGLEPWLDRKPGQLSGGQRQRVAMGRAIVREPTVFLMDEPLSNLDAKLRVQMRAEVSRLQRRLGVATFYVTHDQTEAMTMGDRVAVIRTGVLAQVGPPQVLYDRPDSLFVAAFIGSPSMNLYEAKLVQDGTGARVEMGDQKLALDPAGLAARPGLAAYAGRRLVVGIRPEDITDAAHHSDHPAAQRLKGSVELVESLGSELVVHFGIQARMVNVEDAISPTGRPAEDAASSAPVAGGTGVARFDPRSSARPGTVVEMAVATERLHFFDAETGSAIRD